MNNNNLTPEKNTPLAITNNLPLALVAHYGGGCGGKRRYTAAQAINELAITKFRLNGKGVTYRDLMEAGLATHKKQAQDTLKYCLRNGTLFTLRDCRPQEYYPTVIKSDVMTKQLSKNTPIDPTGVTHSSKHPLSTCLEPVTIQTLEGFVLPVLPSAPLFIHNLHFKVKISQEYYPELKITGSPGNNGKRHSEIIGKACVNYTYYPSGTVNVEVRCSNNPFRLSDEGDRARLHVFFGQIRDRMITFLADMHERIVPDIMEWRLTECDINKDIKVSDLFHFSAVRIQVKHLDHLFRIYIKSMGEDTVCRVEASLHPNKRAIKVIDSVFNSAEGVERMVGALQDKVTETHSMVSRITESIVPCVPIQQPIHSKDEALAGQDNNNTTSNVEEVG